MNRAEADDDGQFAGFCDVPRKRPTSGSTPDEEGPALTDDDHKPGPSRTSSAVWETSQTLKMEAVTALEVAAARLGEAWRLLNEEERRHDNLPPDHDEGYVPWDWQMWKEWAKVEDIIADSAVLLGSRLWSRHVRLTETFGFEKTYITNQLYASRSLPEPDEAV